VRWQRAGDGDMSKIAPAVSQTHIFGGSPREVRSVRDFVGHLVNGYPAADAVVLLSSELATNAILHTASGADGTFCVSVLVESRRVRVEVHDLGSVTAPAVRRSFQPGESGAGLRIVDTIADRWGTHGGPSGRVVWFEMDRQ
jgi:serine/threonine-protein kinase RsbW